MLFRQSSVAILGALLFLLSFCHPLAVHAQWCFSSYTQSYMVASTCSTTPLTLNASLPCSGCTFTWNGNPVSGQGTPTTTYQFSPSMGWGHSVYYLDLNVYNPNPGCTYGEIWDVGVGAQPSIALPALQNGPWNGDTSKTWIYARTYLNPGPQTTGNYIFTPTWTASGGTIIRQRHVLSGPYYYDSVYVKWTGPLPMALHESQVTTHQPPILVSFNCNWTPAPTQIAIPGQSIFYNGLICPGSVKTFFTFPFANSTYTWSITNGNIVNGQGTNSAQIEVNGPGTITVVRDNLGTLTTTNISVNPTLPTINLGPDQTVCAGTPISLNAGSGFTQYIWSTGATTSSIIANSPGTYHVTANINGACSVSDTIQITHLPVTTTNLGPDLHVCSFPLTLDAGPGFAAYIWSTGATTETISVGAAGSYRVTVTNANGCTDADTVSVFNNQPTVNLPATQTFCQPGLTTLSPGYTNTSQFLWSNGATTNSTTVSSPGTYWVRASNIYGCQASDTIIVSGLPRPTPQLGPDQTVCPGTSVTFNAGSGYSSYLWSTFVNTQTMTTATPGTYRVTVTGANGCTGSDTVQLSNFPFTAPNLGPDINVCQPSATLNAGPGYNTYLWNTGATTQTISVSTTGNYSVTVTSSNGCTGSDNIHVTFSNFSFSLGPNVTVCEPQHVILNPQLVGTFTYNWSTGATTPTLNLSNPGTYNVSLTASNTFGCTASDNVVVSILPTPASPLGNDTILCADTSLTLDMGPAFSSYAWSTGATTQLISVPHGGVYNVTATASNGCIRLDTMLISDLIDCVFPGDVNYDHGVDLLDVLALGTVIGQTGPARPSASTNWYGQQCLSWPWNVTSGVNCKQADTDGNGIITQLDTLAIQQNFGYIHNRIGTVESTGGYLRIVPQNANVVAGDIAYFDVYYEGANGTDLDSVYGLGVQLQWPTTGLTAPGLVGVDYSPAWFAPGSNHMDFSRTGANSAYLAISRTSGTNATGHGLVMTLAFQTDSTMAPGNMVTFAPQVVIGIGTTNVLTTQIPSASVSPIHITGLVNATNSVFLHAIIKPVPADAQVSVQVDGIAANGTIQLINLLGKVVAEVPIVPDQFQEISTHDLPAGSYCIRIQTERGSMVKKILISHE